MKILMMLVAYQIKHFLADYPLQGQYMLGKFKDRDWVLPLAAHCAVHALFTAVITGVAGAALPHVVFFACFDFSMHFVMDRVKASPKLMGRWKPLTAATYPSADATARRGNTLFWWALGFDQMWHHLTHYAIIYWLYNPSWLDAPVFK